MMASKSNPTTALHGANRERDCIRRKVRRLRTDIGAKRVNVGDVLDELLQWINDRSLRYARKPGGLGTSKRRQV